MEALKYTLIILALLFLVWMQHKMSVEKERREQNKRNFDKESIERACIKQETEERL